MKEELTLIKVRRILYSVSTVFNVYQSDLLGRSRLRHISEARSYLMWLMKHKTSLTLKGIGTMLGGRHHTTIMNGCESAENLAYSDAEYNRKTKLVIDLITKIRRNESIIL